MEMGSNLAADEEYINIELRSSSSSPNMKDFEFQQSSAKESAADDLFYKGKLLPLHLPPRRQMLEHLLCTSTSTTTAAAAFDHHFISCSTAPCTNSHTPSDSCNISPSQSRRASCDLNISDGNTLFEINTFFKNHHRPTNNSWSKKLKMKMINHSFLTQKLKSSRAYLKSFFTKSAENSSSSRISRKFATLIKKNRMDDHRRSFSGAISTTINCSSSSSTSTSTSTSSSFNSSGGLHELQFLRRSSSAAEIEVSIDAAIAHCKKTMHTINGIDC